MKDPAFLLYSKDFTSGTTHMSPAEVGAYLRLLLHQHQHGSIPNHTEKLMRITGIFSVEDFKYIWETVSEKFVESDQIPNHLVNQRLTNEMTKRASKGWKKVASGALAGHISRDIELSELDKKKIKKAFKIGDYEGLSDEEIKSKVKIWFSGMVEGLVNQMVNQMVNNNANANASVREIESKDLKRGYGGKTFAGPEPKPERSDWQKLDSPLQALRSPLYALRFSQLIEKDADIQKLPGELDFFLKKWESSVMANENSDDEWRTMSWSKLVGKARRYLLSIVQDQQFKSSGPAKSLDLTSANA